MTPRGIDLESRVRALESAVAAADGRLDGLLLADAREVAERARERSSLSGEHTVVAVAGSTGSGKSSVVNALAGTEVAVPGTRRPTTSHPRAAVWGTGGDDLLRWLEVRDRVDVGSESGVATPGLILLDLPDHDSVVREHRRRAERVVARADLLVWVVDPQKYADASLHDDYLRPLADHDDVVVVVLNQVDRLTAADARAVRDDLERLVTADGLPRATVLAASARTGVGIVDLSERLGDAARRREAALARVAADVRVVAERIVDECGDPSRARDTKAARQRLIDGLEAAAGVETVVSAVRVSARRDAQAATGWPPTRWLGRLRADPLRRLGLRRGRERPDLARTSLPVASVTTVAEAHMAVREYARSAADLMPERWGDALRDRVDRNTDDLPNSLDGAIAGTRLDVARRPAWWSVVNALQWAVLVVGVIGGFWLAALGVVDYFRLPELPVPTWNDVPVPTIMLLGAVVVGLLLALLSRFAAALGARRRAARVRKQLRRSIGEVADELVRLPVAEEQAELARCRTSAVIAAG
ncbi:GTPase [Paraoerskovia marina]|uniref:GTPase n=1 Tax=Paraoerskovia marina TaxID=545619 RepID=UPI000492C8E0|nr:GTPase [Paraoerskovia marina]